MLEQALQNVDTYMVGIRKLFTDFKVAGAENALDVPVRRGMAGQP